MTSEIRLTIQVKLGLIVDSVNEHKLGIIELQATTTWFLANGILELQKQRLTILEEGMVKVAVLDVL